MLRNSSFVVVLLALAIPGLGQGTAPKPADARPAPPRVPAQVAPAPGQDDVTLQYPNSDVADVLHIYEQLTGKKLVMDNGVQGKVNIFIAKPLPREEAIKLIEMNLALNGFSLVPVDKDTMDVIGLGKNPRVAPVPIISDEADIPDGEQTISYLFKLNYADPVELQQVLIQYLGGGHTYASVFALQKSSSLLVTESSGVVRKLAKIVAQVDIPPAEVVSEFIKLERADAAKVVDMLKDIFEKNQQQQGGVTYPGGIRPGNRVPVPVPQQVQAENDIGALTALSEESVIVGKIKLAADVRTNRIHVITRPVNIPFIRKLIAEFDANVEFAKPVTRPLRYISANDVLPVLVQALTEPGMEEGAGANAANPQQNQQQQQNQQRRNNTNANNPYTGNDNTSQGGSLNVSEELSTQPVDTAPKAVTIGNAKIIADQRSNSIIVLGNREVVVKVEKILDEMDISSPQVALSTVIGELSLNNDEDFGLDYFAKYNNKVVGISRNTGAPLPIPTPPPTSDTEPNPLRQFSILPGLLISVGFSKVWVPARTFTSRPAITSRPSCMRSIRLGSSR